EPFEHLRRTRRDAAHPARAARPAAGRAAPPPARRRQGDRSRTDRRRPCAGLPARQFGARTDEGTAGMSIANLSQALQRIEPSRTMAMTDRATELREQGRDIISLSVGEPDFPTPPHVIEAAKAALDGGQTKYTPVTGTS